MDCFLLFARAAILRLLFLFPLFLSSSSSFCVLLFFFWGGGVGGEREGGGGVCTRSFVVMFVHNPLSHVLDGRLACSTRTV